MHSSKCSHSRNLDPQLEVVDHRLSTCSACCSAATQAVEFVVRGGTELAYPASRPDATIVLLDGYREEADDQEGSNRVIEQFRFGINRVAAIGTRRLSLNSMAVPKLNKCLLQNED